MVMAMYGVRAVRSAALMMAACLFVVGCAGRDRGSVAHPAVGEYPRWVRMVPSAEKGTRYFVGGCAVASSLEEGIAFAAEDVEFEVEMEARRRFFMLFDEGLGDARAQTTGLERARLRNEGSTRYSEDVSRRLEVEDVYHRDCTDEGGENAVCEVFVLFGLDDAGVDEALATTLVALKSAFRDEGNATLQAVVERMQRLLSER